MFLRLVEWLEMQPGSTAIRESLYLYPYLESIHVWTLTLFVGLVAILDLRLLGLALRRIPVSDVQKRLFPWTMAGFAIMTVSGLLLFYAIPIRTYHSVWFRGKLIFLALAGLNAWLFHTGIYRRVAEWDLASLVPRRARIAGLASLLLWTLIIAFGRMIAYSWFDCDVPQSALVQYLAGCPGSDRQP
jgi:hypothetical protein